MRLCGSTSLLIVLDILLLLFSDGVENLEKCLMVIKSTLGNRSRKTASPSKAWAMGGISKTLSQNKKGVEGVQFRKKGPRSNPQ